MAGPSLEWLRVREGGVYIDCTVGMGGHSALIAERLGLEGRLIALDRDPSALKVAKERLQSFSGVSLHHGNYADLSAIALKLGIAAVDGILIDAGISSVQLDDVARGFSFQMEGPLDMRIDPAAPLSAKEYLAAVSEDELGRVLREYGDLRAWRRLARTICEGRVAKPIETTGDLVSIVSEVFDFVQGTPDEVRTVFQAIRIAVNDELKSLEEGLRQGIQLLRPGGRFVVIAFHSGEDRLVKSIFREFGRPQTLLYPDGRTRERKPPLLRVLTSKPLRPSAEEIKANSRAKSAKLRAAERLDVAAGVSS